MEYESPPSYLLVIDRTLSLFRGSKEPLGSGPPWGRRVLVFSLDLQNWSICLKANKSP